MIDKDAFLKPRLPERELEVGPWTVRIRGLSRAEYLRIGDLARGESTDRAEVVTLALGLVDPALSEDEVRAWRDAATSDEVDAVSSAVIELSAGGADALKAAVQSFRDGPGEGS